MFLCFSLIVDEFPSVEVCYPVLVYLNRLMTIAQRYTTVAFIYLYKILQIKDQANLCLRGYINSRKDNKLPPTIMLLIGH